MPALDKGGALDPGAQVTASFAFGSPELHDWMDRNPGLRMLRTETVNDPALIARHRQMASVNPALQVDLFAQANASRVHPPGGGTAAGSRSGREPDRSPVTRPKQLGNPLVPRGRPLDARGRPPAPPEPLVPVWGPPSGGEMGSEIKQEGVRCSR